MSQSKKERNEIIIEITMDTHMKMEKRGTEEYEIYRKEGMVGVYDYILHRVQEFEDIHKNTDWEEVDFWLEIDNFCLKDKVK